MIGKIKYWFTLLLTAAFILFSCKKEYSCEGCKDNNKPPIAVAGPDQVFTLPTDSVLLDGNASSDPDGTISEWLWTKISGPASFNIVKPPDSITKVKILAVGTYQFELKVTDAGGLFAKDTMKVIVTDTLNSNLKADWEIIITLPIDSAFIDDYFRDGEGTCVRYISGPVVYSIDAYWVKDLVPGIYFFRRYWTGCILPAELIKITVIDNPNQPNTITFKNMLWEYNHAIMNEPVPHTFLSRPQWPGTANPLLHVFLQMDFINNGQWFQLPSYIAGYNFWYDCLHINNSCLNYFVVRISPEYSNWEGRIANIKIKIL